MNATERGSLIIIGGRENSDNGKERPILEAVAHPAIEAQGTLIILTVATDLPQELAEKYLSVFRELGVREVQVLDVRTRDEASLEQKVRLLDDVSVIFFTGGDQLRITSQIGETPLSHKLFERWEAGALVAGTSAGAAVMCETMFVAGPGQTSAVLTDLSMAPGLGFLQGVVIDSHFAERGRMGRLLGAVAQNPRSLGLGIDEDTALVVDSRGCCSVLGSGAVYVVDGGDISYSSLSEAHASEVISIHDVRLHMLGQGARFDLAQRRPLAPEEENEAAAGA